MEGGWALGGGAEAAGGGAIVGSEAIFRIGGGLRLFGGGCCGPGILCARIVFRQRLQRWMNGADCALHDRVVFHNQSEFCATV